MDLRALTFHHFGKDFIKRYGLIPDFFVQLVRYTPSALWRALAQLPFLPLSPPFRAHLRRRSNWRTGDSAAGSSPYVRRCSRPSRPSAPPSRVAAADESGHTRLFYHGRTETIRSCTEESVAFCKIMTDPNAAVRFTRRPGVAVAVRLTRDGPCRRTGTALRR